MQFKLVDIARPTFFLQMTWYKARGMIASNVGLGLCMNILCKEF